MSGARQIRRHLPGEAGIWVFIFGDILVFSLFFSTHLCYRRQDLALFVSSQARLDQGLGVLLYLQLLAPGRSVVDRAVRTLLSGEMIMQQLWRTRATVVWLLLVGATALSWEMGHGFLFREPRHAGAAIIIVAFIKVRFVIREFMELGTAPLFMGLIADAWLLAISAALLTLYLA